MIKMLRSRKHGDSVPVRELSTLRQRIAELEASQMQDTRANKYFVKGVDIFRVLVEHSPDGIVLLNSELEVLYENPAASRILGYQPGEFIEKDTLEVIHPEDMSKAARRLTRMVQNPDDTGSHAHLRVRHNDGTWRMVDVVANNLLHNPTVNGIIVVIHKISRHSWEERAWDEDETPWDVAQGYQLTETEYKVLTLIAEGRSNPQIAELLVVSPSTVRFHVTSILLKLGVTSRTEAAAIAVRRHLVD
jgi:PAS domain S-box-containing protein